VQVAGDKPLVEKISPEARRAAVRTASAALGLGTLLACTGAGDGSLGVGVRGWVSGVGASKFGFGELRFGGWGLGGEVPACVCLRCGV
jgi:hypothetical protein